MLKNIDTVEEFWQIEDFLFTLPEKYLNDKKDFCSLKLFEKHFLPKTYKYFFLNSARNSLKLILKNLKNKEKKNIYLPAFNCSVVENAIKEEGFNSLPYDFSEIPGKYDWDNIISNISEDTAAIIVTHHFGIPVNFDKLIEFCKFKSIPIIEDAAHCLGGTIKKEIVGSIGDASIFSFNYDKPISLGWGGIANFNSPHHFRSDINYISNIEDIEKEYLQLKFFVKNLVKRRNNIHKENLFFFKILKKISYKLNMNRDFELPNMGLGPIRNELLKQQLDEYKEISKKRNSIYRSFKEIMPLQTWFIDKDVNIAISRIKFNAKNIYLSEKISKTMQNNGIRIGNFNWPELISYANQYTHPYSYQASQFWLDMPCHQNILRRDIKLITEKINSLI